MNANEKSIEELEEDYEMHLINQRIAMEQHNISEHYRLEKAFGEEGAKQLTEGTNNSNQEQ